MKRFFDAIAIAVVLSLVTMVLWFFGRVLLVFLAVWVAVIAAGWALERVWGL